MSHLHLRGHELHVAGPDGEGLALAVGLGPCCKVWFEEIKEGKKTCLQSVLWYFWVLDTICRSCGTLGVNDRFYIKHMKLEAIPRWWHQSRCKVSVPHTAGNAEQLVTADSDLQLFILSISTCSISAAPPGMPSMLVFTSVQADLTWNLALASEVFYLHSADVYLVIKFPMAYQHLTIRCLTSHLMQNRLYPGN